MYFGTVPALLNIQLTWTDRTKPGVYWFIITMGIGAVWSFLIATFTLVPSPELTLALANFFWAMIPAASAALFAFAYEYVYKHPLPRLLSALLFLPAVVLFVATWFDPGGLVFSQEYTVTQEGYLDVPFPPGVVIFLIAQLYGYTLSMLAIGLLIGEAIHATGKERIQTTSILLLFLIIIAATTLNSLDVTPAYYDPTATFVGLSGILFAISVKRYGLLDVLPVARDQVFENVGNPILLVDSTGEIIECNKAARELFPEQEILTENIRSLVPEFDEAEPEEVSIDRINTSKTFGIKTQSVDFGRGSTGQIFVFSDITNVKNHQMELELMKTVLSRVLRHNIKNRLNLVQGYAGSLRDHDDETVRQQGQKIYRETEQIVTKAEKVRLIERILSQRENQSVALREVVSSAVSQVRDQNTERSPALRTSVTDHSVHVHPLFDVAIREVIQNAIEHVDDGTVPKVEVTSEQVTPADIAIRISDNGPGIPSEEIDVLDNNVETSLKHSAGIGLWLVKFIVTRSKGSISFDVDGSGSTVEIIVPVAG